MKRALFITLALLTIPVAIFMTPVILRVRASAIEAGYKTTLLTNIKAAGNAILFYTVDFDDRFPPAHRWVDTAETKTADHDVFRHVLHGRGYDRSQYEFAFNSALDCLKLSDVDEPSYAIMLFQTANRIRNSADPLRSVAWWENICVTIRADATAKVIARGESPKSNLNGPMSP